MTMLPKSLLGAIKAQVEKARKVWESDRAAGLAGVHIRGALGRTMQRAAERLTCGDGSQWSGGGESAGSDAGFDFGMLGRSTGRERACSDVFLTFESCPFFSWGEGAGLRLS